MNTLVESIQKRLKFIYKEKVNEDFVAHFFNTLDKYKTSGNPSNLWDEKDSFLITYGDSFLKDGEQPLETLKTFADSYLKNFISTVHILPFFPYSSDDGFSVIDFRQVNPELGDWKEIRGINSDFKMMADLVINHISAKSEWVKQFCEGKAPGKDFVLTVDEDFDASQVVRPRSSPLLTPFKTVNGEQKVWTTFSDDQVDLNYFNPELLLEMIDILLFYISQGIGVIRLDAIAFLWKRSGTGSLHEEETHEVVKLMRDVVDYYRPGTVLLTETNVPHKENISYFGEGDEAHMVYQFSLPPLLLHALHTGNSQYLTEWALTSSSPGKNMTFFNFTASHDGIGVRPLEGLLPSEEKDALFAKMEDFGGRISTRRTVEGTDVPYELNITYFDALKGTKEGIDELQIARFVCSQTVMMALQGVPAFYVHSLMATPNYQEGVAETGRNRTINRKRWNADEAFALLEDASTTNAQVFSEVKRRFAIRKEQKAFHPDAEQEILVASKDLFVIRRFDTESAQEIICISNMTADNVVLDLGTIPSDVLSQDILSGQVIASSIALEAYQTVWLTK